MNQEQFNEAYFGKPESINEDPRVKFQLSVSAIERAHDSAVYAGRLMAGAGISALSFGGLTTMYVNHNDLRTATLTGIIAACFAAGTAFARHRGGQYLKEETQLRIKHSAIKASYDQHLKEEDLNQRRSQGHNV